MNGRTNREASIAEAPRYSRASVIAKTATAYFLLVFAAGMALGPIRVLWLEPLTDPLFAVLCETPFLLAAILAAAHYTPRWTKMTGRWPAYLAVGLIALTYQQLADLAVGWWLRGMTLAEQLALFATPPGYIYAFNLTAFAVAPMLARPRRVERG